MKKFKIETDYLIKINGEYLFIPSKVMKKAIRYKYVKKIRGDKEGAYEIKRNIFELMKRCFDMY